jgi:7,8-dihydropterin-6-yl-methyl-4-(beta-D-ribofuranosyl)aminobenzene 5'-phosphate synthase
MTHRRHPGGGKKQAVVRSNDAVCPDAALSPVRTIVSRSKDFVCPQQKGGTAMKLNLTSVIAGALACAATLAAVTETALAAESKITILNDAFGDDAAMKKDWGFSALVEVAGKRILFDTGNDRDIFAANVKAKNIDLTNLDFVVLSHRHSDHMAGLSHVLSVNPKVKIYAPREGFGIYGSSLPSSFYRKDESLPPQMRYYDGKPPEVMTFGTAWQGANFEPIEKTTEVAPGITLIALVSDAPGTRELRELSLAVNTADGLVLLVGCSHPGIDKIVEAAAAINPKIYLIAGGFHLVVAPDDTIAKTVAALKDTFKVENVAPGHCTGEPTFAALKQAFGNRYIYAGVGTSLPLGPSTGAGERRGEGPALEEDDLITYRKLARREDPFGVRSRNLR